MSVFKTELLTDLENETALAAKAFAHLAKAAILHKCNACVNGNLVWELGLAQANISQHPRHLKDITFIQGTIKGARVSYCINPERWLETKDQFIDLVNQYHTSQNHDYC